MYYWFIKQECIPVGCVPTVSVAVSEGWVVRCLWQHPLPHCMLGHTPLPIAYWDTPPLVDRRKDTRLWKHYLPVSTVAGGNCIKVYVSTLRIRSFTFTFSERESDAAVQMASQRQWSKKCPLLFRIYLHSSNAKAKDKKCSLYVWLL